MPRNLFFTSIRRWTLVICAFIVACGVLTACGSSKKVAPLPTEPATPKATITAAPTPLSGPPRIGAVEWTTAIDPQTNAPLDMAPPTTSVATLYAVVPIESLPAGSQLLASWYFNNTSLDALDAALRVDRDRTSGWVEFHIERTGPDPWPDGTYRIVIGDGTNELQSSEIAIS